LDKDGLQRFFEEFGPVVDSIVMVDQNTKRSRGFGFVTFEDGTGGKLWYLLLIPSIYLFLFCLIFLSYNISGAEGLSSAAIIH